LKREPGGGWTKWQHKKSTEVSEGNEGLVFGAQIEPFLPGLLSKAFGIVFCKGFSSCVQHMEK